MPISIDLSQFVTNSDGTKNSRYPLGDKPSNEFPYDSSRAAVAGAYHVDPVNGSDANNGILVADGGTGAWQTINTNLATLVAGDTVYLREGTHTVNSLNMKFGHNSGSAGNLIEITSYPGEEPLIDCSGDTTWLRLQNLNYWKFSHLKLTNYISAWEVGEDITADNCEWFSIQGDTALGGDNVGLIKMREASNFSVDRIKVTLTVDQATVHQNTGGLYHIDNNDSISGTYNRIETYGFPSGIYFKHGFGAIASHTGNITVSNSFFYNCNRNAIGYNPAGVKFEYCIFHTNVNLSEADGGEAGDWNWFDHCTFYASLNLRDQLTGATNNRLTNSIVTTLDINGSSSVTSDSDYNLFVNNIEDGATSRDLASWQTTNSSDASSVQGTPTYFGSDFSLIESYALANGSAGENASSTGSDVGADVSKVGVLGVAALASISPLGGVSFDGLASGQSITPLVTAYGTLGNGYGCQGDTAIKRDGKTSSCNVSIQSGTTGRPGDGTPVSNGDFGFIYSLADQGHQVLNGEELWVYGWVYIPSGFNFNTAANGLKFLRFSYLGLGPELDTYISDGQEFSTGDNTENAGWHLVNESYPQLGANTRKETQSVFVKGQWNFFCKYTKASTSQADSVERLWINDQFVMEHVGGASDVTTKWIDETGTTQTATWTPSAGSGNKWATLSDQGTVPYQISSMYLFTYWNNNAPQDQSINIQQMQYVKSNTGLATDSFGNRYVQSTQVV